MEINWAYLFAGRLWKFLMLISKLMRYAEKLGLDPEELMEMTVLDAALLIDSTQDMWLRLEKTVE